MATWQGRELILDEEASVGIGPRSSASVSKYLDFLTGAQQRSIIALLLNKQDEVPFDRESDSSNGRFLARFDHLDRLMAGALELVSGSASTDPSMLFEAYPQFVPSTWLERLNGVPSRDAASFDLHWDE